MNRYDVINLKTGEVKEDLKARTISALLDIPINDVAYYDRNGLVYDNTYKIVLNRKVENSNDTSIPVAMLEEWDQVTSKFRRYYNEKVFQ